MTVSNLYLLASEMFPVGQTETFHSTQTVLTQPQQVLGLFVDLVTREVDIPPETGLSSHGIPQFTHLRQSTTKQNSKIGFSGYICNVISLSL